jgi:hypothetical protein
MDIELIKKPFKRIGAEVTTTAFVTPRWSSDVRTAYKIDVREGVFEIAAKGEVEVCVVDVNPRDKHLLLNVTEKGEKQEKRKHKFLMGFDERDWFVAAIPESFTWVKNVTDAKQVLKPEAVVKAEQSLTRTSKNVRKNKAWVRQGEWFFIPVKDLEVDKKAILKNEPVSRGNGGKPHLIDEVYRTRGELVYVSREFPAGITQTEFAQHINKQPHKRREFRMMTRNAEVFAKSRVRHADHATIFLDGWHRVMMNTEAGASSMRNLAFLD